MDRGIRLYHVVCIRVNPRTGERVDPHVEVRMTATPVDHDSACVILSKCVPYRHGRRYHTAYTLREIAS
jgi:hypothetical protein